MKASNSTRSHRIADILFATLCAGSTLIGAGALSWIVLDLLRLGWSTLSWDFFTGEVLDSGRAGGIGPVLISTVAILSCSLGVTIPIGIGSSLWLSELAEKQTRGRWLSASIDILASVPSIVFGLFGMAFFCVFLGLGFSIASGGLTLACMILPTVIRTTTAALRAVPSELRPGAAALGLSRTTTLFRLLIPRAFPGIAVGLTIGTARALSETAALIFTSGYGTRWPSSVGDSGRSLSVHIYDLAMNIPGGISAAAASALVLLIFLLITNTATSTLSARWLRSYTST